MRLVADTPEGEVMTGAITFALNHSFFDELAAAGVKIRQRLGYGPAGVALTVMMPDGRTGSIIVSQSDQPGDVTEYLHASIAIPPVPTYDDLCLLHRAVFGRRRWAYQVFAPEGEHVNIRADALHLWGRADGKPLLPDFGQYGTI
jgi:hypothetical protein